MVSIVHFEDMKPREILASLDLEWEISEKIDGSYLRAGIDDSGRHYTQRKNAPPCYQLSDWSTEAWAQVFRSAHLMADLFLEHLKRVDAISAGSWIDFELIYGSMPNTIPYNLPHNVDGVAVVTAINQVNCSNPHIAGSVYDFNCSFSLEKVLSADGKSFLCLKAVDRWKTGFASYWKEDMAKARLKKPARQLHSFLSDWYARQSGIPGFTILDVLEVNLGRRHELCPAADWNKLKSELKTKRTELKQIFESSVVMFKDLVIRMLYAELPSSFEAGSMKEGFVVQRGDQIFKLVDRDQFSQANSFTHMIKYWLVGGRRPNRSCFISRTKDWPKDKRLARLDELLSRYIMKHWTMHFKLWNGGQGTLIAYSGDLHERVMNLFADTRKRLEDGR